MNPYEYDTNCGPSEGSCLSMNGPCLSTRCQGTAEDFGPYPYVTDIEEATLDNPFYRRALWTGEYLQLTLMCIAPGDEIGLELHPDTDQFLRIEQGCGRVMMGTVETILNFQRDVFPGSGIFVPAGIWHNLVNTGHVPLKLYTIYAPPHHPAGTLQCTRADAAE